MPEDRIHPMWEYDGPPKESVGSNEACFSKFCGLKNGPLDLRPWLSKPAEILLGMRLLSRPAASSLAVLSEKWRSPKKVKDSNGRQRPVLFLPRPFFCLWKLASPPTITVFKTGSPMVGMEEKKRVKRI